jgi:peptide/nickel transport system substrate-binding protein
MKQPRIGGTLRIGSTTEPTSLDPHLLGRGHPATPHICDLIARYDEKGQPQPELAESFDFSKDATRLELKLRKGVLFHSGREFTADDVKYNILRVRDPKVGVAQLAALSKWIKEIETPDKYTVVLKFDGPRPAIFDMFESMYIGDKDILEGPDAARKAGGTGPFKFVEWVPGDRSRIVKNKDHWRGGRPYLDEVVFSLVPDAQTLVIQLESGAVDIATGISEREAARLRKDSKYSVDITSSGYNFVAANATLPPTDNKKVRQALNYAIDRKRFVETTQVGLGTVQALPWPSNSLAYDAAKAASYGFNLDKAAALLKEAGVSNLEIDLVYINSNTAGAEFAQVYQADLAKIGVKGVLQGVEPLRYRELVDNLKFRGVVIATSGFANLDPSSLVSMSKWWQAEAGGTGFNSEKYSQFVKNVAAEPDPLKRKQLFVEFNDYILDESFMMTISPTLTATVSRENVQAVGRNPAGGALVLTNAWLA